ILMLLCHLKIYSQIYLDLVEWVVCSNQSLFRKFYIIWKSFKKNRLIKNMHIYIIMVMIVIAGGGGPPRQRRGEDILKPFDVTLEDLYNGKTAKISIQKDVVCPVCNG